MARLTSERDALKKDVEVKNNDILEKNKTITQVKKIGRRYKTQYEELKAQHDKVPLKFWKQFERVFIELKLQWVKFHFCASQLVSETASKAGSEAVPNQEAQQELNKVQEELEKTREELNTLKEEAQKKQEEVSMTWSQTIISTTYHQSFAVQ